MARADLLALSEDDLSALGTRGMVKQARKELESRRVTASLEEVNGHVRARWSDGVECDLPPGRSVREGKCSCDPVGLCRHLVRTVLAYQQQNAGQVSEQAPTQEVAPWDPGAITDEELARLYHANTWRAIRARFEEGIVAELVRSARPTARFHQPACTVRFLVPGDPQYAKCDCGTAPPCWHVPQAVWAFRLLPPGQPGGMVTAGQGAAADVGNVLGDMEKTLTDLCDFGVSGAPAGWMDRLGRLEERCRQADLVWPAEALHELAAQQHRYGEHDARFDPDRVADLVGELAARLDAIRADTGALPQVLIRGTSSDRPVELGSVSFVGLGCMARPARKHVELVAYLQDADSGSVVVISKDIADHTDADRAQKAFADLAQGPVPKIKGTSFYALGVGQLLLKGGKRTAGFELELGQGVGKAGVNPQNFTWEKLQPPVLASSFAELEARFASLPPACLRPRRAAEDFHVLAVAGVQAVRFHDATQTVEAILVDGAGQRALLSHPYTTRGQAGAELLLSRLASQPSLLKFVSGQVRRTGAGLVVHPACLVWEEEGKRTALQPWVERPGGAAEARMIPEGTASPVVRDALTHYLEELRQAVGELLLLGLARADTRAAQRWRDLIGQGEGVGFGRLAGRLRELAELLEKRAHTLDWDVRAAGSKLLEVGVLARLAHDVVA